MWWWRTDRKQEAESLDSCAAILTRLGLEWHQMVKAALDHATHIHTKDKITQDHYFSCRCHANRLLIYVDLPTSGLDWH